MTLYVLRRFVNYVVLLFIAVTLAYFLAATQLEPRAQFAQQLQSGRPETRAAVLDFLNESNLDTSESVFVRYGRWLGGVFTNDWGVSPGGGDVRSEIATRMWVSLRLVTVGSVGGAVIGTVVGAWSATRQYKLSDRAITMSSLLVISIPTFVIAIGLQVLAIRFNNATGTQFFKFLGETGRHGDGFFDPLLNRLQHLLLPTITLAATLVAIYSRIQRNIMLDNLDADYVRTAQAKGLSRRKAVFKHALRTSLIPTATYFAFTVGLLFTGSLFVEQLFGWHGMGEYTVQTIANQDINGAVASAAFAGVLVAIAATLSEIFVAALDPRVRVR